MAIQRSIEYDVPDRTETVQNIITNSNGIVILLQAKIFASKLRIVCISTPKNNERSVHAYHHQYKQRD